VIDHEKNAAERSIVPYLFSRFDAGCGVFSVGIETKLSANESRQPTTDKLELSFDFFT